MAYIKQNWNLLAKCGSQSSSGCIPFGNLGYYSTSLSARLALSVSPSVVVQIISNIWIMTVLLQINDLFWQDTVGTKLKSALE